MKASARPPSRRGFWVVAAVLGLFLAAASAPSPLYATYAARWHFGPATITVIFAVYAIALLAVLLTAGSLSDSIGRRPVILTALLVQSASMLLFVLASGVIWLYAARTLQGAAIGLATAAVAAALIDLQPATRPGLGPLVNAITPTVGLAAGALAAGGLVQYGPAPLRLVYALLLAGSSCSPAPSRHCQPPAPALRSASGRGSISSPRSGRRSGPCCPAWWPPGRSAACTCLLVPP